MSRLGSSRVVALLPVDDGSTRLAHGQAQVGGVDLVVAKEEQEAKARLGEDVEDAVEDGLRVRVDDVAALGQAPGDGIQKPQEDGEHAAVEKGALDRAAEGVGVAAGVDDELGRVGDVRPGSSRKRE